MQYKHALQVYNDSPVVTDSVYAATGTVGLTMHFHGNVASASILKSSGCSHSLMSAAYARQVSITMEPPQEVLCYLVLCTQIFRA